MTEWKIKNNTVYGNGQSYTLHNRITAETLYKTLTNYETITQQIQELNHHNNQHQQQISRIQKQITSIQMTTSILNAELEKLEKETHK